jgi:hypothetical protein
MKKLSFIFLLLAVAFLFTACEQPEGPQSLIGHWNVVGDHWTATLDEEGQLYISSTKYDTGFPYHYTATTDSLYIQDYATTSQWVCAYEFKGNSTLVISDLGEIFHDVGSVADKIKKQERVVLTRTPQIR